MKGILLVDKPAGMTSHDVVDRIRRAARMRRVGHTGTLDPAATGLLILCLGPATRLSEHFTAKSKVYEGTMRLGVVTDSYDLDGAVVAEHPVPPLDRDAIQAACDAFTGTIQQVPPMVSAVKVGGERLYKKARKGQTIEREPRTVNVSAFDVLSYTPPDAAVRITCSSGTYVRSLCHDAGQALGCGAALASLRRLAVGQHRVEHALPIDALDSPEAVEAHLLAMGDALDLPAAILGESGRAALAHGNPVSARDLLEGCPVPQGWVQMKDREGELLALGIVESRGMDSWIHPKRVFIAGAP
ncbi:MAG: tRNA pseudouridine(55) synthase TruB [Candidatus Hydrogenedentes bacterium]|nr:tRNA pseudouridine(55) synthase TruB [Candidatus Hydrogenedentota bacterium]